MPACDKVWKKNHKTWKYSTLRRHNNPSGRMRTEAGSAHSTRRQTQTTGVPDRKQRRVVSPPDRKRSEANRLFDTVEMEFVVERLAIDAEQFGRLRLVAAGRGQSASDLLLLGGGVMQRIGGSRG